MLQRELDEVNEEEKEDESLILFSSFNEEGEER